MILQCKIQFLVQNCILEKILHSMVTKASVTVLATLCRKKCLLQRTSELKKFGAPSDSAP